MRTLSKLGRLTWLERGRLLEACIWLGMMQTSIQLLTFRFTTRFLGLTIGEDSRQFTGDQIDQIGWAIRVAAAHTPWKSTCLVQALAGMMMLKRRGLPGTLYLGVAKSTNTTSSVSIDAHAWLSSSGKILVGAGVHERFNPIAAFKRVGS